MEGDNQKLCHHNAIYFTGVNSRFTFFYILAAVFFTKTKIIVSAVRQPYLKIEISGEATDITNLEQTIVHLAPSVTGRHEHDNLISHLSPPSEVHLQLQSLNLRWMS